MSAMQSVAAAQLKADAAQMKADAAQQRAQAELDAANAQVSAASAKIAARELQQEAAKLGIESGTLVPPVPPMPPVPFQPGMPSTAMITATLSIVFIGFPIAIALSRAIWRWAGNIGNRTSAPTNDVVQRLQRIEQAVESIAIEVERVSEGQRFTTKLLSEGAAQPASVKAAEAASAPRG